LRRPRHDPRRRACRCGARHAPDSADRRPRARAGPEHRRRRAARGQRDRPERRRALPSSPHASSERGGEAPRRGGPGGGAVTRIGLFGIGLDAYWPQFEGLRERLEGYQRGIEEQLRGLGAEVVSAGLVDTPQGAREAGELLARERIELVLLYTATYA